jgi:hypothetical protein
VFFLGGLGMMLVGLETFGAWRVREKQDDEDGYLDVETAGQAVRDPLHRRH